MKFIKSLFLLLIVFQNAISQIDTCKDSGLYLDGYKVKTIDCCNFNKLQVVVPYNDNMNKYSFFNIWIKYKSCDRIFEADSGVSFLPRPILLETVNKGCFIFTVFNPDELNSQLTSKVILMNDKLEYSSINKMMFCETLKQSKNKEFSFWLEGLEIIEKKEGDTKYSLDEKNGMRVNIISKVYKFKCYYNSKKDCENTNEGFKLDNN